MQCVNLNLRIMVFFSTSFHFLSYPTSSPVKLEAIFELCRVVIPHWNNKDILKIWGYERNFASIPESVFLEKDRGRGEICWEIFDQLKVGTSLILFSHWSRSIEKKTQNNSPLHLPLTLHLKTQTQRSGVYIDRLIDGKVF